MNAILSAHYDYVSRPDFEMSVSINNATSTERLFGLLSRFQILNTDNLIGTPVNDKLTVEQNSKTSNEGTKCDATFGVKLLNTNLINLYPEFTTFTVKDLVIYYQDEYVETIGDFIWSLLGQYLQDFGQTVNKTNFAFVTATCHLHD